MEYNIRFTLDYELSKNFNELIKYHKDSDYFKINDEELRMKYESRLDNIKNGEKIGNTGMSFLEIPARKVVVTTNKEYNIKCPLCLNPQVDKTIYPYNLEKLILWRGYLIKPNTFPYFKLHYLIQSSDHIEGSDRGTQNETHRNPNVIGDMLLFAKTMNNGSILFNGWVGNSLGHLHFHYTDTHFPIKRKLKDYPIDKEVIETNNESKICIYKDENHNCKNFILIKGVNPNNDLLKLVQHIDSLKLFYNLLLYWNKNVFFIFVFIRRKEQDDFNFNFGAAHMSGLSTFSNNNLEFYKNNKNEFLRIIDNYCSKTVVKIDAERIKKLFL
jgi:hypothetical protein